MTNKEAIEWLSHSWIVNDDGNTDDKRIEAGRLAIEALEKADKYRWHDLRKNPDDLPKKEYETCEVCLEDKTIDIAICHLGFFEPWYAAYFFDCPSNWYTKVIAWREIEPFEVTE